MFRVFQRLLALVHLYRLRFGLADVLEILSGRAGQALRIMVKVAPDLIFPSEREGVYRKLAGLQFQS
jgi:hypothetical protein